MPGSHDKIHCTIPCKCTAKQNDTMLHFTNTLHDETEKRLRKIESSFESMIERAAAASEVLEEALCRLKAFIAGYTVSIR